MIGDMQKWSPNVASIIEHAKQFHPETEVISRMVSGDIHRTNYDEVCVRSRKLASALVKDGYKEGDVIATLALNTYRHLVKKICIYLGANSISTNIYLF